MESVETGRTVIAHAGAGKQTSFAIPQIWTSLTSEEMMEFAGELQELYVAACRTLGLTPFTTPVNDDVLPASPTQDTTQDAAIVNEMLALLPTVTQVGRDYSALRWPTRL